jgi:hypothetical protein
MIQEHDRVVLMTRVESDGLEPGDVGAIVHVYAGGEAYEVEFTTLEGETAAVVTLDAGSVRPVNSNDITHTRVLHSA